jgi:hypothetical protein
MGDPTNAVVGDKAVASVPAAKPADSEAEISRLAGLVNRAEARLATLRAKQAERTGPTDISGYFDAAHGKVSIDPYNPQTHGQFHNLYGYTYQLLECRENKDGPYLLPDDNFTHADMAAAMSSEAACFGTDAMAGALRFADPHSDLVLRVTHNPSGEELPNPVYVLRRNDFLDPCQSSSSDTNRSQRKWDMSENLARALTAWTKLTGADLCVDYDNKTRSGDKLAYVGNSELSRTDMDSLLAFKAVVDNMVAHKKQAEGKVLTEADKKALADNKKLGLNGALTQELKAALAKVRFSEVESLQGEVFHQMKLREGIGELLKGMLSEVTVKDMLITGAVIFGILTHLPKQILFGTLGGMRLGVRTIGGWRHPIRSFGEAYRRTDFEQWRRRFFGNDDDQDPPANGTGSGGDAVRAPVAEGAADQVAEPEQSGEAVAPEAEPDATRSSLADARRIALARRAARSGETPEGFVNRAGSLADSIFPNGQTARLLTSGAAMAFIPGVAPVWAAMPKIPSMQGLNLRIPQLRVAINPI